MCRRLLNLKRETIARKCLHIRAKDKVTDDEDLV